jgi:hypothetical protein
MRTSVSAVCRSAFVSALLLALTASIAPSRSAAQDEPKLIADVADFNALLPLLPEPPPGWNAEKAEGSTDDMGDTKITTVHRDYDKGDTKDAPTTSISILDSVASPEYVEMTTAGWKLNESTPEGYTKSLEIEGNAGFEAFENDGKHGTLWLLVAKRYFLQIEITAQDAPELHEWLKRIDLKKLAAVK